LSCNITYDLALAAVLAGHPLAEVDVNLRTLSSEERQRLLCDVCSMHNEIAFTCQDRGLEILKLLTRHCPLFIDGRATCLQDAFGSING
jgi:hypothetical protein